MTCKARIATCCWALLIGVAVSAQAYFAWQGWITVKELLP